MFLRVGQGRDGKAGFLGLVLVRVWIRVGEVGLVTWLVFGLLVRGVGLVVRVLEAEERVVSGIGLGSRCSSSRHMFSLHK